VLAGALLRVASREYLFVDEWDVAAPAEAVFEALADARTYPKWWRPVYLDVDADGPAAVGAESRQHSRAACPGGRRRPLGVVTGLAYTHFGEGAY
jgi:uncharacterized protein YndB with AHSA1/START domain